MKDGLGYVLFAVCAAIFGCGRLNAPPTTPAIAASATVVASEGTVNLSASATDPEGDPLTYAWTATGGALSGTSGQTVTWTAPAVSDTQQHTIGVEVRDTRGASASGAVDITVVPDGGSNRPPETPPTPNGPASGRPDTSYYFWTSADDPDGDSIAVRFDWGDGRVSDWGPWSPSGQTLGESHSYETSGSFEVAAQVKDRRGAESGWSPGHTIVVSDATDNPIVFISNRAAPGNYEIYSMSIGGDDVVRLTNNGYTEYGPRWSPDGQRIVFSSWRSERLGLYIMEADGSNERPVGQQQGSDGNPSWSPNGLMLCFDSDRNGCRAIYTMMTDGTQLRQLTPDTVDSYCPDWSPDGSEIAFVSNRPGGGYAVCIMDVYGGSFREVADGGEPAWSPDGSRIAFQRNHGGYNWEIYVVDADGANLRRLTSNSTNDGGPRWSPDGTKIIFFSGRDGNDGIWIMNEDGTDPYCISHGSFLPQDADPDWK